MQMVTKATLGSIFVLKNNPWRKLFSLSKNSMTKACGCKWKGPRVRVAFPPLCLSRLVSSHLSSIPLLLLPLYQHGTGNERRRRLLVQEVRPLRAGADPPPLHSRPPPVPGSCYPPATHSRILSPVAWACYVLPIRPLKRNSSSGFMETTVVLLFKLATSSSNSEKSPAGCLWRVL